MRDSKPVPTGSPAETIDALEDLLAATTERIASRLADAHPADAVTVLGRRQGIKVEKILYQPKAATRAEGHERAVVGSR